MPDPTPLAHHPRCTMASTEHRGSCCTCGPGSATCRRGCPDHPDQQITADRLDLLVRHASIVQNGFTTPEVEYARARKAQASNNPIDWDRLAGEVADATEARMRKLATGPGMEEFVTVTDDDAPPPDEGDGIPTKKVERYQQLRDAQAAAEAEAKAIKDEANLLEAELVEAFGEAGMQSINIGGRTVYLQVRRFGTWIDTPPEERQALLVEAGAEDLITTTVNANTFTAWVKELIGDEDNPGPGLPELLAEKVELGEQYSVRIKASTSAAKPKSRNRP